VALRAGVQTYRHVYHVRDRRVSVSAVCDICGKKPSFGRSVSRQGRSALRRRIKGKSPRQFKPNIQSVRAVVDGTPVRMNVCTACLKAGKVTRPTH
jgi:large subunit ribosomal protein L28